MQIKPNSLISLRSFGKQQQVQFLLDLLGWLKNGCSTIQALHMMRVCADEAGERHVLAIVFYVESQLAKGRSLAKSLERNFVPDLVMVMKSSHDPRELQQTISELKKQYEERQSILTSALKQLVYPIVLLFVSLGAVWISGAVILPRLSQMLTHTEMPFWSQQLAFVASALPWVVVILCMLLMVLYTSRYLTKRMHKGPLRTLIERLSSNKMYRLFVLVDICFQLGLLLRQRCNMGEAVSFLMQSATGVAEKHYQFMQQRLAAGYVGLADVMNSELLDAITLMRLQMSSGTAKERSVQLHEIAQSMQYRAVKLMHKRIRWGVVYCYLFALLLIGLVVTGVGQLIVIMVAQWG